MRPAAPGEQPSQSQEEADTAEIRRKLGVVRGRAGDIVAAGRVAVEVRQKHADELRRRHGPGNVCLVPGGARRGDPVRQVGQLHGGQELRRGQHRTEQQRQDQEHQRTGVQAFRRSGVQEYRTGRLNA